MRVNLVYPWCSKRVHGQSAIVELGTPLVCRVHFTQLKHVFRIFSNISPTL